MPLARFALYESGIELYVASTADDSDGWQSTLVHIARESRCFVIAPSHFQRAASYPERSASSYPKAKAAPKKAPAQNPASHPAGTAPPKE